MEKDKNILVPLSLIESIMYYLNTRDDERAWEYADELQAKIDRVRKREIYARRLEAERDQKLDDWFAAIAPDNEKEGV